MMMMMMMMMMMKFVLTLSREKMIKILTSQHSYFHFVGRFGKSSFSKNNVIIVFLFASGKPWKREKKRREINLSTHWSQVMLHVEFVFI